MHLRLLKLGVPLRDGVFGALLRPPRMLSVLALPPLPSIRFKRRKTSASVERKHTISSCCVRTRLSKSCTRPARLDFSDSSISSNDVKSLTLQKINLNYIEMFFIEIKTNIKRAHSKKVSSADQLSRSFTHSTHCKHRPWCPHPCSRYPYWS